MPTYRVLAAAIVALLSLVPGCKRTPNSTDAPSAGPVRVVSWGGALQASLLDDWVTPASVTAGVKLQSDTWKGDHAALTLRIKRGINDWDLVHVEQFYVDDPAARDWLERFPNRRLSRLTPGSALSRPDAVPLMEYGYVLAYRSDQIPSGFVPDWPAFWNVTAIPGRRAVRDWPMGNIEIALLSLGRNPQTELYDPSKSRVELEQAVGQALDRFEQLRSAIDWWSSGDQIQRYLTNGDVALAAAYTGRTMAAHKALHPQLPPNDARCTIRVNPATVVVGTDWWIIPKGAPHAAAASRLLEAMFTDKHAAGAQAFSEKLGYRAPCDGLTFSDSVSGFYLNLGSTASGHLRLDEAFWGRNHDWIDARWRAWRTQ